MERNNTLPLWIGAIVLVVLVGGLFYFGGNANAEEGTLYVTVSDAAADMGNVTEVSMTLDKVELHSAAQGWVTVSNNNESFDLLALNASGDAKVAAKADLKAGTYDQLRVTVSEVRVDTRDAGEKEAIVVAKTMTLPGTVVVEKGASSHVDVDVQTSLSLHTASSGEYVFAPVIVYTTTHGGEVTVQGDVASRSGGSVDTRSALGTDLSGNVVVGAKLSPTLQLSVSGNTVTATNAQGAGSSMGMIEIDSSLLLGGSVNGSGSASGSGSATSTSSGSGSTSGGGSTSGSATTSVQVQGSGSGSVQVR